MLLTHLGHHHFLSVWLFVCTPVVYWKWLLQVFLHCWGLGHVGTSSSNVQLNQGLFRSKTTNLRGKKKTETHCSFKCRKQTNFILDTSASPSESKITFTLSLIHLKTMQTTNWRMFYCLVNSGLESTFSAIQNHTQSPFIPTSFFKFSLMLFG